MRGAADLEIWCKGHKHLLLPVPGNARDHILLRHIGDALLVVLLGVISEHHALDAVLRLPKPAFLEVVEDRLDARLGTGGVALVPNADA